MTDPGVAPYLELARRIELDHRARSGHESVSVVPVLVADLERAQIVAQCLSDLLGGAVLGRSAQPDLFQARAGHPYAAVRSAVEESLTLHYPSALYRVLVELTQSNGGGNGLIQEDLDTYQLKLVSETPHLAEGTDREDSSATALSEAVPFSSLSGGQQAMIGLAAALLDADLVAGEVALVLYDETGMDTTAVRACWSLVMDQMPGMTLGALRTLVVIVGTSPSIPMHAAPGRGCRFAIVDNRLLERKPLDSARGDARAFATRQAPARVLFLGAGFSVSSRLPLGNALRDSSLRRLMGESSTSNVSASKELARRFRAMLVADQSLPHSLQDLTEDEFAEQLTLEQVLPFELDKYGALPTLLEFGDAHARAKAAPGTAIQDLAALLDDPKGLVLVTVNFDELIESLALTKVRVFATDKDFAIAADYVRDYLLGGVVEVPYLKLHGTISTPESCVVTTTQTEQGIDVNRQEALQAVLDPEGSKIPWTYVGASMRDIDLRPTLQHSMFGLGLDERWAAPFVDPAVEAFAECRRPYWGGQSLQSRLITETADSLMHLLAEVWSGE